MVHAKNYKTVSTFLEVMQRKLWPLFSEHGVYCCVSVCLSVFLSVFLSVCVHMPSVLWCCWLGDRKSIRSVKTSASKLLGIDANVAGWDIAWSTLNCEQPCTNFKRRIQSDFGLSNEDGITPVQLSKPSDTSHSGITQPQSQTSSTWTSDDKRRAAGLSQQQQQQQQQDAQDKDEIYNEVWGKGQNPLHQFPRNKSARSPQHKQHVRNKSVTSWHGQKSIVSVVSCRFSNSVLQRLVAGKLATSWQLPCLWQSYGETCLMDFGHNHLASV